MVGETSEASHVRCVNEVIASTNFWTRLTEAEEQPTSHWHWPHSDILEIFLVICISVELTNNFVFSIKTYVLV